MEKEEEIFTTTELNLYYYILELYGKGRESLCKIGFPVHVKSFLIQFQTSIQICLI